MKKKLTKKQLLKKNKKVVKGKKNKKGGIKTNLVEPPIDPDPKS